MASQPFDTTGIAYHKGEHDGGHVTNQFGYAFPQPSGGTGNAAFAGSYDSRYHIAENECYQNDKQFVNRGEIEEERSGYFNRKLFHALIV